MGRNKERSNRMVRGEKSDNVRKKGEVSPGFLGIKSVISLIISQKCHNIFHTKNFGLSIHLINCPKNRYHNFIIKRKKIQLLPLKYNFNAEYIMWVPLKIPYNIYTLYAAVVKQVNIKS